MSINSFREDEEQKEVLKKETLIRLFKYLLKYKKQIAAALLLTGTMITITLVNPLIIQRAINVNLTEGDWQGLLILAGAAFAMYVYYLIALRCRMKIMQLMTDRILFTIREELYNHIQTLGFGFFDSRPTGKILARIIGDVNGLKDVLTNAVITFLPDFIKIIAVAVIMFILDVKMAFAGLLTLPILAVIMIAIQRVSHIRWQKHRKKSSNLNAFLHEDLSGMKIVQSFSAEKESMKDFEKLTDEHCSTWVSAVRINDMFGPSVDICTAVASFLLYFVAIRWCGIETTAEAGTITAFAFYLSMFWSPIRNLANFYNQLVTNISAAERVFEIMDTDPELFDKENVGVLPKIDGEVTFKNVSFAYADDIETQVLHDVSFTAKPGETIALVGPTGAGKTTVVNLISRFYDTVEGDILVDGHNVKNVTIESLRGQMGVMTQDNFHFSGTVKENVRYGKLDATDEEIIEAAKAVNAHEFIMQLENGYDTELSDGGSTLSSGQKQLLAFARTMVSQPRILILDEATSSIDTHTEMLVQQGIENMLKGRTSFVIAHRLSTIKKADRIFVIDHGCIQESGSHKELIEKKGQYYELYQAQFKSLKTEKTV